MSCCYCFFFSSRRRHTRLQGDWSSDVCSSDLEYLGEPAGLVIELDDGFKLYFAGDTNVFGDMQLIGRIYRPDLAVLPIGDRSEERRVGKECRSRWSPYH